MARLDKKVCTVVGAGQTPGETIGNGRATAIVFAREGARLLLVDIDEPSLVETANMISEEGGECKTLIADVTIESDCLKMIDTCISAYGQVDVLHYNVGRSEGDGDVVTLAAEIWDELMAMNLRGLFLTCKYALPAMRERESGVITAVSSAAAVAAGTDMTYKTSKAAMNALIQGIAINNARYGIRANTIMPGLMDTPMAIERRAREQKIDRDVVRAARDSRVPLNKTMGTAWDVAYAALFLASDEASFITGVNLPVDGGQISRVG